jgi:hypothetical protein
MQIVALSAVAAIAGKNMVNHVDAAVRADRLPYAGGMLWLDDVNGVWFFVFTAMAALAGALLAPAATLLAAGLVQRAVAHWRWRRATPRGGLAERCGAWFNVLGSLGLAAVLGGSVIVNYVFMPARLGLVERTGHWYPPPVQSLRIALLLMAVLLALSWTDESPGMIRPQKRWTGLWDLAALPVAGLLCLVLWINSGILHVLVFLAVRGVENHAPQKFVPADLPPAPGQRMAMFWEEVSSATIAVLVCLGSCWLLARCWKRGWIWPAVLVVPLVTAWGVQLKFLAWAYPRGIYVLSPSFAETLVPQRPHAWVTAFLLAVLTSIVIAYRSARTRRGVERAIDMGDLPRRCFHEGPLALGLMTLAAIVHNLPFFTTTEFDAIGILWFAVLWFCINRWWAIWRNRGQPRVVAQWELPPGRFAVIALAMLGTMLVAAPTLVLFGFAQCFGPWIYWRVFELV